MKTKECMDVEYTYCYFEDSNENNNLFAPKILQTLPKIGLNLPKINLVQNFELAFC